MQYYTENRKKKKNDDDDDDAEDYDDEDNHDNDDDDDITVQKKLQGKLSYGGRRWDWRLMIIIIRLKLSKILEEENHFHGQ